MESRDRFVEQGHLEPVRVLTPADCLRFLREVRALSGATPLDWNKGWAVNVRPYFELGCHPAILARLTELLGRDVLLWGASLVTRKAGSAHSWHCDVESAHSEARAVSVWLGLEHCGRDSSLQVIPGSHRYGVTVQEMRARHGMRREEATTEDILRLARERAPGCAVATLEAHDGEAVFFDGRIWHSSNNRSGATRTALLLQYATPDTPIRIPVPGHYEWPFRALERPLAPCVLVSGEDGSGVNRVVPGPAATGGCRGPRLTSRVYPLALPLAPDPEKGWRPYPIFRGATAGLRILSCHISALARGRCPHPPHQHDDEELLVVLAGEVDVVLPELPDGQHRLRLQSGEFVYYPANFLHTLEGASDPPANYLMFKWLGDGMDRGPLLRFGRYSAEPPAGTQVEPGFRLRRVFEGPTRWLHRLHCHTSSLTPGGGYKPHVDAYDVAIIALEGVVESLDRRVEPHGVLFYAAGEPHGIHNPGDTPARYVVFEFHSRPSLAPKGTRRASWITKVTDPRRWRRKLGQIARWLRGRLGG